MGCQPAFPQRHGSSRCSHPHAHLIYDGPHVFQVRGERHRSAFLRPCDDCFAEAKRQAALAANVKYEQRCSRMPPRAIHPEHTGRPRTSPPSRTSSECTWENFMKKKSKHGRQPDVLLLIVWKDLYISSHSFALRPLRRSRQSSIRRGSSTVPELRRGIQ